MKLLNPTIPLVLSDLTAATLSPVSHVPGKAFNRFVTIWLENTDYEKAIGDPNLAWLTTKGITLTNYYALTHPSEPNYVAAVSGDYYGINNDNNNIIPPNISTIVDLLEDRGISWGEYMEDMPHTGFTGTFFRNPITWTSAYVKKHNPLIMHASVSHQPLRRALTKNFTMFYEDLRTNRLPQWMFVTPNQRHNGHDTSVTVAGQWARDFVTPLLNDKHFMNRTMVLITFDENETYPAQNRVFSILLGDAVPNELVGTRDPAYYNHYSELSTVQANWDLHSLGRYDVGANVFSWVAEKTGDKVRTLDVKKVFNNESYPGIFHSRRRWAPQPVPDTEADFAGRTVLRSIKEYWGWKQEESVYKGAPLMVPTAQNPPISP